MIQANELRIGNWVIDTLHDDEQIVKIEGISCSDTDIWDQCHIEWSGNKTVIDDFVKAIPLTIEILEKAGFERPRPFSKYRYVHTHNNIFGLNSTEINNIVEFYYESSLCDIIVNSVHQLQNLYFALTGQELTINL